MFTPSRLTCGKIEPVSRAEARRRNQGRCLLPVRSSAAAADLLQPAEAARAPAAMAIIPVAWLVCAVALSAVALMVLMVVTRLRIDPSAPSTIAFALFFALAAGLRYGLRHPASPLERIVRDLAEYVGIFVAMTLIGATATYPVAALTHGFADPALQEIDAALRFDWIDWYEVVAAHRSLQLLGTIVYQSIYATPAVLLGYFAWTNDRAAAHRFITAFWLSAVMAMTLFSFMPAEGPLATLWHGPMPYLPDSALYQSELIPELRLHLLRHVDLGALRGLVCAPSYHTVSAVLFIATAWPSERLRRPITVLNVAMLLATPVEGTHYLIDMILGSMIAVAALRATGGIIRQLERQDIDFGAIGDRRQSILPPVSD